MDKVMYSIGDLNNTRLNIVCKVPDKETFNKLREFCPNMNEYYDEDCDYYLTSRGGRGKASSYNNLECPFGCEYILIEMDDIDFDSEGYVFDNGIPFMWEDEV